MHSSCHTISGGSLNRKTTVGFRFSTQALNPTKSFPFSFFLSSLVISPPRRPFTEKQYLRASCKMKCSGSPDDYLPSYIQTFHRTQAQPGFSCSSFWILNFFMGVKSFVFTLAMYMQFHFNL